MSLITIRCRRCLESISNVEPGALVGCVSCRLLTRATLTHQPLTRITCRPVPMGYQVFFIQGRDFDSILDDFKAAIPKKTRGFIKNHWHVAKRVERKLFAFLDSLGDRAAVVRDPGPSPATSAQAA